MVDTWLHPPGDLDPVARFCGISPQKLPDVSNDLGLCVETAVDALERRVGPVVATTVTEYVEPAGASAALRFRPSALTSWVGVGDVATIRIDGQVVHGPPAGRLPAGLVTYSTGYAADANSVPAWARTAALLLTRHLWRTQLGNQQASAETPGSAWLWPKQVEAIIAPYELAPVVFT